MPRDLINDAPGTELPSNDTTLLGSAATDFRTLNWKRTPEHITNKVAGAIDSVRDFFTPEKPAFTKQTDTPDVPYTLINENETDKKLDPNGPSFGTMVGHEIDNGLGQNLYGLVQDYGQAQPDTDELFLELADKADALTEKYGWDSFMLDELLSEVNSVEELERKAERINKHQGYMASLENTSMAKQLAAGFAGFVAAPINLIPGGVVLKAGSAAKHVFPRIANSLLGSKIGKASTFAAMGAVEEAARNYPRLLNDPVYSYEMYRMDVAIGAGFGAGIAAIPIAGRFAKTKISKGVNEAVSKYKTSLEARMAVNTLTDTLRFTKNPKAAAAVKEARDAAMGEDAVKAAKKAADVERAQRQVNESVVNKKLNDVAAKVKASIDEGKVDAEALVQEFSEELRRTHPTFAKIADAVAERVQRAADKAEAPKSAGAAGRKETLGTKVGDKVKDMSDDHASVKATLDEIDRAFDLAQGVAKGAKDLTVEKQLNALRSVAKRGVIEKAKIAGVKPRTVATPVEVHQAVYAKYKNYQKTINRIDFELNKILKEAGVDDRNILSPIVGKSFKQVGVVGYKNFTMALKKDPELGKRLEVVMDENMQRMIDDIYHASPNADASLYRALDEATRKVRADVQWSTLAVKERNIAQISMDPEWSLISHEFQQMMGGDFAQLDELYNKTFNKVLRNQFGGFTRSYAGELAASQTPLAQWAALHLFELPGGTGGKVARKETAAISMEMFNAEAVHPVNAAWDKAVRQEAKDMGLGMLDSAVMRHSSASADRNANSLGRKIQIEMNARQMGKKSDAPSHIKEFADELEKAYDLLYKRQHEHGVEGITGTNKIKSYMRQSWSEDRVLSNVINGDIGLDGFEQLVTKSLRNRNPEATPAELKQRAKTVVDRLLENVNNREGKTKHHIVTDGDYINERVLHLDLDTSITLNGKEHSILDFMSNDVVSDLNKYAKKTSAMAAISKASGGKLNSADAISSFIHAVGQESQAMGTHVDVGTMTDAFKLMMGEPIKGFHVNVRKTRDAVALSGMNGLGESQLAELGLAINRGTAALFAANQVASRVAGKYRNRWRGLELTPEQASNTALLEEMQSVSTLYEQMHNLARQNVHFDDMYHGESVSPTMNALNSVVDKATGGKFRPVLQHAQTKHTGYGSIRTMQEQVAMAGLMHDVGRKLAGKATSYTSDSRLADIGIPMDLLQKKIKDGSLQLDAKGNIKTLGLDSWSAKEQHSLGVALRRHAAQQVQVGFAGETSALMSNPWVAFMMQFRSYPNIAAEKQQLRNAMFMDKEAAMGVPLNAASSMGARVIRYQSLAMALPEDKRERYLNKKYQDLGHDTFMYMGYAGTMVNTYDIAQDPTNITPPFFGWARNYIRAADGLGNGMSSTDVGNIASAVPLGTIAQANLISGMIKEMMEADDDDSSMMKLPHTRGQ